MYIEEYLERVEAIIGENGELSKPKLDKKLEAAKIEYNKHVFEASRDYIIEKLPQTKSRIEEAIGNPEKLGLNRKDLSTDITPGKILIVLLFGTKKKPPKAKECSALDFIIHEKLRKRLVELDSKLR